MGDEDPPRRRSRLTPKTQPRQAELLWTLERDGHVLRCELRAYDLYRGFEVHVSEDGLMLYARRFRSREAAVEWADGVIASHRFGL